jgi:hypothetical protein
MRFVCQSFDWYYPWKPESKDENPLNKLKKVFDSCGSLGQKRVRFPLAHFPWKSKQAIASFGSITIPL